jgi:chromate transporter
MIYLQLFASFFKIGLFSFGGGYAMITLISDEIAKHHWLLQSEFVRIIGIAEMTPGPIAVNSATFIGYKTAGILGATLATAGVALPSLLIILFASSFFFKNAEHPLMKKKFMVSGLL